MVKVFQVYIQNLILLNHFFHLVVSIHFSPYNIISTIKSIDVAAFFESFLLFSPGLSSQLQTSILGV